MSGGVWESVCVYVCNQTWLLTYMKVIRDHESVYVIMRGRVCVCVRNHAWACVCV